MLVAFVGRTHSSSAQIAQSPSVTTIPEPAALMILIRSTIAAVNHANLANSYTTLYELGSSEFKTTASAEALSRQLKPFRDQNLDLSAIFAVTPVLDEPPKLSQSGTLELNGHFPTSPLRVTFRLAFRKEREKWKHSGLAIGAEPETAAP